MSRRHPRALLVSVAVIATASIIGSIGTCLAQTAAAEPRRFDLRIENGRIAGDVKTVQVQRDDAVELRWTADGRTDVHLHGYNIEVIVNPGQTQVMAFRARATGRFSIEAHGARHTVLLYLEVHPR
jgi:Multicopper oxidase